MPKEKKPVKHRKQKKRVYKKKTKITNKNTNINRINISGGGSGGGGGSSVIPIPYPVSNTIPVPSYIGYANPFGQNQGIANQMLPTSQPSNVGNTLAREPINDFNNKNNERIVEPIASPVKETREKPFISYATPLEGDYESDANNYQSRGFIKNFENSLNLQGQILKSYDKPSSAEENQPQLKRGGDYVSDIEGYEENPIIRAKKVGRPSLYGSDDEARKEAIRESKRRSQQKTRAKKKKQQPPDQDDNYEA